MLKDTGELFLKRFTIQIVLWEVAKPCASQTWDLIPVRVEGAPLRLLSETPGPDTLPSYDGNTTGQSSTRTEHAESESESSGDFGTIVTEVTVITTRKKYRVEDTQ